MATDQEQFRLNYLVSGLPDDAIDQVAAMAEFNTVPGGKAIIQKGEKTADLFVILEGQVNVYADEGAKIAQRGPGSVLGEIALVDDNPRSAYAVALGNVRVAKLDGRALRRFMFQNRDIGFIMLANLSRVLSMRLRQATETIEDLQGSARDPWEWAT